MDWLSIVQSVISSGLLVGLIEYFRFRKRDREEAGSVERDNLKKTYENSLLSIDIHKSLIDNMRLQIETLIDDSGRERDEYRRQLKEAKDENALLNERINELEKRRLLQEKNSSGE
jgi:hypothetical protein